MEGKITKFFYDPENIEFKHHQLLKDTKNIPQCLKVDKTKNALEIEYIEGVDLDDLFERYHYFHEFGNLGYHFNAAFTYVYCYDLLNAVEELAHKNLHHRDIHQKNVRISLENKAYLLDMGITTTSRTDTHPLNRSCGGNNDLISIGQLAYKMRTGKNPFEPKSKSNRSNRWNIPWNHRHRVPELTSNQRKNNIQERRNRVYHNGHVNPNILREVRTVIKKDSITDYTKKTKEPNEKFLIDIICNLLDRDITTQPDLKEIQETKKMYLSYLGDVIQYIRSENLNSKVLDTRIPKIAQENSLEHLLDSCA
ncbi:MAG: hypothetical protein R6V53_05445, partial [Candidatus Woesearchaeota archaeon]